MNFLKYLLHYLIYLPIIPVTVNELSQLPQAKFLQTEVPPEVKSHLPVAGTMQTGTVLRGPCLRKST